MKIEIWSDVVCPFCYISKKNFEKALSQFENKIEIEIIWRSYELYPDMITQSNRTFYEYMAERDEISTEEVSLLYDFVLDMAKDSELELNLEKALLVNTKNAHLLIQLAKKQGLGSEAEENLFHAYFVENKNIDDFNVLSKIADEVGISYSDFRAQLISDEVTKGFEFDLERAINKEVKSVPFFLFNDSFTINGAQDEKVFLEMLNKAWLNYQSDNQEEIAKIEGKSCSIDGNC